MVREEENGSDCVESGGGGSNGVTGVVGSSPVSEGMTQPSAPAETTDTPAPAPTPSAEAASCPSASPDASPASRRLARTQDVIEHLQQNLSTRLKDSTVQALRASYSGDTAAEGSPPQNQSSDDSHPNGAPEDSPKESHVGNGSVPVDDEAVIRKKTDEERTQDSRGAPKTRVSWTTKLLERLTQEESQKKEKAERQRVVVPQRRLVRYPGQKDFVPTHVPAIAKRVSSPPQPGADARKEKAALARSRSEDRPARSDPPPPPPPRRETLPAAADVRDAYADFITELTQEQQRAPRPKSLGADPHLPKGSLDASGAKSSAYDLYSVESVEKLYNQLDSVPRPKSVASDLLSPNSVFESETPRADRTPASAKRTNASRKTIHGDYFLFSKEFVEANADPIYARPRKLQSAVNF